MVERPLTPAEERRLKMLQEAEPNTWLALDDSRSRCVGRGKSIQEAVDEARRNGFEEPIMFLVPPQLEAHDPLAMRVDCTGPLGRQRDSSVEILSSKRQHQPRRG
jgi:hypothetical protein